MTRAQFAGERSAPAQARKFVATSFGAMVGYSGPPDPDAVVLIVSELVTNSVRAGAAVIDVHVTTTADRVDLRVSDDADGWPTPRRSTQDEVGGRGLLIVEELADSWSTTARHPGKTVTATWFRQP